MIDAGRGTSPGSAPISTGIRSRGRCSNGRIRWLETHIPEPLPPVLCHRDFRTGNYMLDGAELTGDPRLGIRRLGRSGRGYRLVLLQGLALCAARPRGRRHRRTRDVLSGLRGGIGATSRPGARAVLGGAGECPLGRHRVAAERPLSDPGRARSRHRDHRPPRHRMRPRTPDAARPGRGARDWRTGIIGANRQDAGGPIRQHPRSAERRRPCWRSDANILLEHVLPLLPPERHRELRLVATAMAIAEREAEAGDAPAGEIAGAAPTDLLPAAGVPPAERAEDASDPERRACSAPLRRRPAHRRIRPMRFARADRACDIVAAHDIEAARGQSGIPRGKRVRRDKARVADPAFAKPSTPSPAAKSSSSPTMTTARTRAT